MRLVLLLSVVIGSFILAVCIGEVMIGPGAWMVEDIASCDDADQYEMIFEVTRKKLNRTHDAFSMFISYDKPITELFGIEIDMYQMVDGGYKYYQYVSDASACNFAKHYSEANFQRILALAGIDPPDCPIQEGEYTAEDFVFNYSELKDPCPYGSYEIFSYLTSNGQRVACLKMYSKFEQQDDE